jgi:hypothetical protein
MECGVCVADTGSDDVGTLRTKTLKAMIWKSVSMCLASAVLAVFATLYLAKPEPVEIPACPACNCPEPTVSVQPFEVEKIKGLKSFEYSPSFTGSIAVSGVDSSSVKRYINQSVDAAFNKYVQSKSSRK